MTEKKVTLVIMAAGIGSRFGGGIKQLEAVGPNGEIIVDYSIYDAIKAGFNKVVFVIRQDLEKDFKEIIGNRIAKKIEVAYAYQEVSDIPSPYVEQFKGRTKPWGTGQAILACKDVIEEPFLVINADDYYGRDAYAAAYDYLTTVGLKRDKDHKIHQESEENMVVDEEVAFKKRMTSLPEIAMISFILKNTLSDFGGVTRGICEKNKEGYLESILETSNIVKRGEEAVVENNKEQSKEEEPEEYAINVHSLVSMNMWCFSPEFMNHLETGFEDFLGNLAIEESQGETRYLKAEYLLPTIVGDLLDKGKLAVKVLESKNQWFGVTYKEDKEIVAAEIRKLIERGLYT